ncbi:MAG: hypothetical protein KAR42_14910 [candidate division Zixibacteria bacterium]|nr:hypothetical protein [candidate division Zixibacteria bacterium]
MTTLKTQMTNDVTTIFLNVDEFAETANYTPKGGEKILGIIVIPDFSTQMPTDEIEGEYFRKIGEFFISSADVAEPGKGDIVELISGTEQGEWILTELIEKENTGAAFMAIRKERKTIGHVNRGT